MKTSIKIILGIVIVALVILIAFVVKNNVSEAPVNSNEVNLSEQSSPAVHFAWRYEDGDLDLDGLPKTKIFLDMTYENGKVVSVKIDEVQGSCNDIDAFSDDKDITKGSTKIQCYAAGFGEWYKIVKGDDSYQVLRKFFVEAHPDSVPPEYSYELVAEVPLLVY